MTSLAKAAISAFEWPLGISKSHQPMAPETLTAFVLKIWRWHRANGGSPGSARLTSAVLEALINDTVIGADGIAGTRTDPGQLRTIVVGWQNILVEDGLGFRLSERKDLRNSAAFGGADIVGANTSEGARSMFAHNHLLLFPELFHVLRVFAPPGAERASAKLLADRFCFCRKLNETNVSYCIKELEGLGIVRSDGSKLKASMPVPACAAAANIVEAVLQVSDYRLDTQVMARLAIDHLGSWMGDPERTVRENTIHQRLGAPEPLLKLELAGAQIRLTRSSFLWLTEHGMVDPLSVGRVLKADGDIEGLEELSKAVMPKVLGLSPSNTSDYVGVFARQKGIA